MTFLPCETSKFLQDTIKLGIQINGYASFLAGVFLPDLCEAQRINPRRTMVELILSSGAAPGPVSSEPESLVGEAPAPAPLG